MAEIDRENASANSDRAYATGKIRSQVREDEPALTPLRWPGNGYLSAVEATRAFARAYLTVYREFWDRRPINRKNPGKHQAPLREHNLFENDLRVLTGLWRARQAADGMGLPYEIYLHAAFEFLTARKYKRLPQPSQLYSDIVLEQMAHVRGAIQLDDLIPVYVTDVRFLAHNYQGDLPQEAFHEVLISHLRGMPEDGLRKALVDIVHNRQLLPEAKARKLFGDEVCDACASNPSIPIPAPQEDLEPFRPGCFGLPGAFSLKSAICVACPFAAACQPAVAEAEELTVKIFESLDPRAERTKTQNRVSKRKQRPRKGDNRVT